MPPALAVLRHRDFTLYWLGQLVSTVGNWMQILATAWLLYQLTGSPVLVGLNGLFRSIPILALSFVGGLAADRMDRRLLLLITQLTMMLLALLLGLLVALGTVEPWQVYAVSALSAVAGAFDGPARQALLPSLVPRREIAPAVVVTSFIWRSAALLGPAIAGLLIAHAGLAGAFFANGLSYIAVVVSLVAIRPTKQPPPTHKAGWRDFWADLVEGLGYLKRAPIVRSILLLEAVANIMGDDSTMLTLFAGQVLNVGPLGLGLLSTALGAGSVLGSLILVGMGEVRSYGRLLIGSSVVYALSLALFGLSRSLTLSLALLLLVGAADTMWSSTRSAALQLATPEHMRGRVMGLLTMATRGLGPLGQLESGLVATLLGTPAIPIVGGLTILGLDLWTILRVPLLLGFRL